MFPVNLGAFERVTRILIGVPPLATEIACHGSLWDALGISTARR